MYACVLLLTRCTTYKCIASIRYCLQNEKKKLKTISVVILLHLLLLLIFLVTEMLFPFLFVFSFCLRLFSIHWSVNNIKSKTVVYLFTRNYFFFFCQLSLFLFVNENNLFAKFLRSVMFDVAIFFHLKNVIIVWKIWNFLFFFCLFIWIFVYWIRMHCSCYKWKVCARKYCISFN